MLVLISTLCFRAAKLPIGVHKKPTPGKPVAFFEIIEKLVLFVRELNGNVSNFVFTWYLNIDRFRALFLRVSLVALLHGDYLVIHSRTYGISLLCLTIC